MSNRYYLILKEDNNMSTILGLKRKVFLLVVVFTVVEVITMAVWLQLVLTHHGLAGFIVLAVGLLVEHTLSAFVGKFDAKF